MCMMDGDWTSKVWFSGSAVRDDEMGLIFWDEVVGWNGAPESLQANQTGCCGTAHGEPRFRDFSSQVRVGRGGGFMRANRVGKAM